MIKIPYSWYSQEQKNHFIEFILKRIYQFREKFSPNFNHNELYPKENLAPSYFFMKLQNQKNIIKKDWKEKYIIDEDYHPELPDFSQSEAGNIHYRKKS